MTRKIFFSIFILFFLASCGKKEESFPVEHWYDLSINNMKKGNLYSAQEALEKIEIEFPYSKFSDKAEILLGFLHFINKDYDKAAISAEKFIKLRPANQYVSYMYFLRAEAYMQQMSDYLRDQTVTKQSKNSFLQLISRFSNEKYYNYSTKSISKINETIANYYLDIGRTHQKKEEYISAISRFKMIIEKYHYTIYAPEAYFRLVETYYALGLTSQAIYQSKILREKFPENIWNKRNLIFTNKYVKKATN